VAEEYLRQAKAGKWKKENTVESFKCFDLERILDAQMYGKEEPERLTQEEYVKLGEGIWSMMMIALLLMISQLMGGWG
jgi:hypothetical protein